MLRLASAGFYKSHWGDHPRLQILTLAQILDGRLVDSPPLTQVNVTFRRATPATRSVDDQPPLISS